ncbi:hypothetical protein IC614_00520 [Allosphingosinicella flava]|uniref:Ammonium transporter n=1 Tax=Allosphingosinicella flava TaxID=2771430 RepID=A0A7T2GJR4_9SPHN|nr:hypothetical protein [Sphingosinicella flava]QPQ55144.1 hypothetical protein IC614_00520 [Sphingosinicella flava]
MLIKKLAVAAVATSLLAAPVAANPASALSLAPSVRAGAQAEGENELFGTLFGTLISLAGTALSLYLAYELIDDEDSVSA